MPSTLFNVLFAWKCSSTHHKMALDALNQIRGEAAENWRNLCLKNIEAYLQGSKAPDDKFKDFKNHVLHVRENYWGGAITATQKWYDTTVEALQARKWVDAIYAAGVLSHYYTDPVQPFHTGQSEAEGIVHRAAEWSIACAYRDLTEILEQDLGGWPDVSVPTGSDWLAKMVKAGADLANPHYEVCIQHYDLKKGVKDPPTGLDQEMKDRIAALIGHAVVGYARIMERAFSDAQVVPPATGITLLGVMSQLTVPVFWITKKLKDNKEKAIVEAAYREFQATGKVIDALSEDDSTIRALHADEVLKKPLEQLDAEPATPIGAAHGEGAPARPKGVRPVAANTDRPKVTPPAVAIPTRPTKPESPEPAVKPVPARPSIVSAPVEAEASKSKDIVPRADRFYLDSGMPVEKAPSIGNRTAESLGKQGIKTVGDLLATNPDQLARKLNDKYMTADMILAWQKQANLCCAIPNLRGHDAQILVACDIDRVSQLASMSPGLLLKKVTAFIETPAGQRILRGGNRPDLEEVTDWIDWATRAVPKAAA